MLPLVGDLLQNTVGKIVGKVVDRYLPKSMDEKEKAEMLLEMEKLVLEEGKILQAQIESVNVTMREEAKSGHWAQWLWRPCVGFTFCLTIFNNYILLPYFINYGLQPIVIPDGIWSAMLVVLGVAAGTRGAEKIFRAKSKE